MAAKKPDADRKAAAQSRRGAKRRAYRRIVVKFGTNLLTAGTDRLDPKFM